MRGSDDGMDDGPDLDERRETVIKILNWLANTRIPRSVAQGALKKHFQPSRAQAIRPIGVERVEKIGELAAALGFKGHNGLYPSSHKDKLTDEVERDLRQLYDIEEDDPSWLAYCAWDYDGFVDTYLEEHRQTETPGRMPSSTSERVTQRLLTQMPETGATSFVSEVLAGVELSLKQSPAGDAWPVLGELRCGIAVIGSYNVAIGRCWVQVDGGPMCDVSYANSDTTKVEGNHGAVAVTWVGGTKSRPVCNVEGLAGLIGRVELPDDFCKVHNLAHGDVVTLRLAVFVGDLERVDTDDDGVPIANRTTPPFDSISFRRKDYQTMGKAAKAAVMQVLAEKRALDGNATVKPLPGETEGWWVVAEARRKLIDPANAD